MSESESPAPGPVPPKRRRGRPPKPRDPAEPIREKPRAPDASERRHRETWGDMQPLRPAFSHLIDLAAPGHGREHAAAMVRRIQAVIDQGGWTASERAALYQARRKWRRRADGKDARYLMAGGNRRGGLKRQQQAAVKTHKVAQSLLEDLQATRRRLTSEGPGHE